MLRRAEGFKQIGRSLRRITTAPQRLTHLDKFWLVAARGLGDPSPSFSGSRVQCMSQPEVTSVNMVEFTVSLRWPWIMRPRW